MDAPPEDVPSARSLGGILMEIEAGASEMALGPMLAFGAPDKLPPDDVRRPRIR